MQTADIIKITVTGTAISSPVFGISSSQEERVWLDESASAKAIGESSSIAISSAAGINRIFFMLLPFLPGGTAALMRRQLSSL